MNTGCEQRQRDSRNQRTGDDRRGRPARPVNEVSARWNRQDGEPDRDADKRSGPGRRRSLRHQQQRRVAEEQDAGEIHRAPDRAGDDDRKQNEMGKERSTAAGGARSDGSEIKANAQNAAPATIAPNIITAGHPNDCPIKACIGSASIALNGQLTCRSDMARTISRPSNQSVVIFVATRIATVAPMPPMMHAASAATKPSQTLSATPEITISARPARPSVFSRKRRPSNPAGNATNDAGQQIGAQEIADSGIIDRQILHQQVCGRSDRLKLESRGRARRKQDRKDYPSAVRHPHASPSR